MLAKEMKIKNLKRQREFIKKQLSASREDGVTSYPFVGDILPEVKIYFESEGYTITPVKSDILLALTKGQPVHLFKINPDYRISRLNDEEEKQAEEYSDSESPADNHSAGDTVTDIIKKFLTEP